VREAAGKLVAAIVDEPYEFGGATITLDILATLTFIRGYPDDLDRDEGESDEVANRSWPTVTIAASVAMILTLVAMRWIPVLDDLADRSSPRSRPGIAASTPDRFLPSRPIPGIWAG
jgi:hypothetical protein